MIFIVIKAKGVWFSR